MAEPYVMQSQPPFFSSCSKENCLSEVSSGKLLLSLRLPEPRDRSSEKLSWPWTPKQVRLYIRVLSRTCFGRVEEVLKDEKASELLELPDPNRRSNNLGPGIGNTKKLHAFDSALFTETGSDGFPNRFLWIWEVVGSGFSRQLPG